MNVGEDPNDQVDEVVETDPGRGVHWVEDEEADCENVGPGSGFR